MKELLLFSDINLTSLILRLFAGIIMFSHGVQKMFGLFGGYGFKQTMSYFTNTMKLPWVVSFLIISTEFFLSLALIMGVGSRFCAIVFIIIMAGAIVTTNYKNGFFMNWFGKQQGEGYEFHLLVIGMCIAILITGNGKYSIGGLLELMD